MAADTLQVKKLTWQRWKTATEYLTGAICSHKNGDNLDFRRDNLVPSVQNWKKYK